MAIRLKIDKRIASAMVNGNRPVTREFKDLFVAYLNHVKFNPDLVVYPGDPDYQKTLDSERGPETPAQFLKRFGWSSRKLAEALNVSSGHVKRVLKGRPLESSQHDDYPVIGGIRRLLNLKKWTDFPWQHLDQQALAYRQDVYESKNPNKDIDSAMKSVKESISKYEAANAESGQ